MKHILKGTLLNVASVWLRIASLIMSQNLEKGKSFHSLKKYASQHMSNYYF